MAIKHGATHTADNQLTAAEYDEAHTVEANTIVDADIGAHTTTKIISPEAKVTFDGTAGHAHGGGTDGKQIDHGAIGGLTDDDHTQYQKESEKAAANGYASLDASTLVPLAQIPATLTGKDADTLDTKHYTDISGEIDSDVSTHAALTATHGATGAIVGTTNTQTLSAKTLTAPKMDVIAEETAAAGVTIDGLLLKDGLVDGIDVSVHDPATTAIHGVGAGAVVGTTLAQTLTNKQRQLQKPADGGWDGDIFVGTAAVDLAIGDLVYVNGSTQWAKADADTEALSNGLLGIALETISAAATGRILLYGFLRRDAAYAWTVGARLYISPTVGTITETRPSTTGQFVRVIGWAYDADTVFFAPDTTYVEVA